MKMRKYKKKYNIYAAWNYEREVEDMNRKSERGWHLIRGKSFSHKYEYNPEVCYRYQLDYQPGLTEPGRYIETYREQGWEFISNTFNGWYYFRKLYDPSLPEEQYTIYTDSSSLKEMNGRWAKIASVLAIIYALLLVLQTVHIIRQPQLATLVQVVTLLSILGIFTRGILLMRNPYKKKTSKVDYFLTLLFFVVLIGGAVGSILLTEKRPNSHCTFSADSYTAIPATKEDWVMLNTLQVSYPDNYFLDLKISAEEPVHFAILNSRDEAVYSATSSDLTEENLKLRLKKGEYRIYLSEFEGGKLSVSYRLE